MTVSESTFEQNSASGDGGAIYNSSGSASIANSTISSNQGAIGGGIMVNVGTLTLTSSTLSGNTASDYGGGIYNRTAITVTNSTIADNSASLEGGGIVADGPATMVNTTIADNDVSAGGVGGGIENFSGVNTTLGNTIVVFNIVGTGALATADDIAGSTVSPSSDYNLVGADLTGSLTSTVASGNQLGVTDPGLGTLASNGGPTQTIALLAGSPAIDAGSNALAVDAHGNPLLNDQRGTGFPRIVNGTVDIGAFEAGTTTVVSPQVSVNPVNLTFGTALDNSQLSGAATATVGGNAVNVPGSFSYTTAVGTVLGAGENQSESVTFTPTDSADYSTVTTTVIVNVAQATPSVSADPVNMTYGLPLDASLLAGTATWTVGGNLVSVLGLLSYTSTGGTVLSAGSHAEQLTFTPIDSTDYQSVNLFVTVNVAQAAPAVSVSPVDLAAGTALDNSQLSGTATWTVDGVQVAVDGTFAYTTGAGTVPDPGATIESVTFTPADSTDYTSVEIQVTVTVGAPVSITLMSSANFVLPDQPVTFTVTVTPPNNNDGTPTGQVFLNVNGAFGTLVDGVATITTSFQPGSYAVTASYGSNAQFGGAVSNTVYELATPNPGPVPNDYVNVAWTGPGFLPGEPVTWLDGTTHYIGYDAFSTVQGGVNAALSGGTVFIAPGTYAGQVTISQNVTLTGSDPDDSDITTTIQAPANLAGDEIAIASGVTVFMNLVGLNASTESATGIDVDGASLVSTGVVISGFNVGVLVQNDGAATITDSTISGDGTGIAVGSSSADNSSLTATNDSFVSDTVGLASNQVGGTVNATLDWWGSATGPSSGGNADSTGTSVVGNVEFSPWLGDSNVSIPDNFVFLARAGNLFGVSPTSGDTSVSVTSSDTPTTTIPGGDTIAFTGSGGTVTVNGETGSGSTDEFAVLDNSVEYLAADGLSGTTVNFTGTGITRDVDAEGNNNTFDILSTGVGGPYNLSGDPNINSFVFSGSSALLGSINGAGTSTLNYADYGSGVSVSLGKGTNGTATGVSGNVTGITAIVGSSFNDTLSAGTVGNVALSGGPGANSLTGGAAGDTVVESTASSFTLSNANVTGTGFTDDLIHIKNAVLTDTGGGNTFTVSGWTGSGSLSGPLSTPDTVAANKNVGYTLTDSSLSSTDGMSLGLSGITTANLGGIGTFTMSGWTGGGSLSGSGNGISGAHGVVTASKDADYTLTDGSLSSTDGMSLKLKGFTTANLAATSAGETFTVSGWTGGGSLSGGGNGSSAATGNVTASKNAGFTLANASLSSTDGMTMVMKGITSADLVDTGPGGNLFTVSGWTHAGSLTGSTVSVDTVEAVKNADFTLTDASLASTDGMSLGLSAITIANLGATSGGKTFTVGGWTGSGLLDGGGIANSKATGIVTASKDAGFTLSNTSLSSTDGMTLGLNGITSANLTDTGSGGNTFTVSDWTHTGLLTGSTVVADTVAANKFANYTLTNVFLGSTDGMSLGLSGITIANLVGALPGTTFTVSGWTGSGSLFSGAAGIDKAQGVVTASKDAGYTLTDGSLSSTDGMSLRLKGITTANLAATTVGNTFTVGGWTGTGVLTGGGGNGTTGAASGMVTASKNAGFTLTNASLSSTDGMTLVMKGITSADLADTGPGGNLFTVSGWTHAGSLTGSTVSVDTVEAVKNADFTLTDASLASTDGMSLGLSEITIANLGATSGGKTFTVGGWTGSGLLDGGGIGNSKATGIVTASKDAGFTLSNTSLSSTDGMTLGLNGITSANLTDTGSGGNTFTVSDWTHTGLLTGSTVVADTVAANKFANYTLTNVFLGSTDGMSLGLSGITIANLVGALPGTTFTVSGWTGSGSLFSGAAGVDKAQGVVTASKDAGYTLTDGSLSSTDGMSLRLKGITTANLAATTVGNTFTVGGWTGTGVLSGGGGNGTTGAASGNVTASKNAGFTLTNASLSSTDGMTLVMKGITSADLADTGPGGNLFTVSGWTHAGSLTGSTVSVDTVEAVKNADFTLTDASLASTDGMSLGLSDITIARTSGPPAAARRSRSAVGPAAGRSTAEGLPTAKATGIVTASKDAGFTLSNTSLSSTDGMTLGLNGITSANLTDTGSGATHSR